MVDELSGMLCSGNYFCFEESRFAPDLVSGYLDDPLAWKEIYEWINAAVAYRKMYDNRLGILGHYYGGMLDVYTDVTKQSAVFGTQIEILEMCELKALRDAVTKEEIDEKIVEFRNAFKVDDRCDDKELVRAACTPVAWISW